MESNQTTSAPASTTNQTTQTPMRPTIAAYLRARAAQDNASASEAKYPPADSKTSAPADSKTSTQTPNVKVFQLGADTNLPEVMSGIFSVLANNDDMCQQYYGKSFKYSKVSRCLGSFEFACYSLCTNG